MRCRGRGDLPGAAGSPTGMVCPNRDESSLLAGSTGPINDRKSAVEPHRGKGEVSHTGSARGAAPARPGRARVGARLGLSLGLVLVTASACSSEDLPRLGLPTPASEEGERILSLWQGSWIAALTVGAVVWGLMIWSVIFYRQRSDELPAQTRYNLPIEVLYTAVPFIIISVLFFFTARDEAKLVGPDTIPDDPDQTINVVGRQWSWSFNYLDHDVWDAGTPGSPPTLVLPVDQTTGFQLTSPDVIHSFWVPAFIFKMDVMPGRVNEFALTPNREGVFAGKCAELCGVDHSRMLFTVEIVSAEEYEQHMANLRAAGQTGQMPQGVTEGDAGSENITGGRP